MQEKSFKNMMLLSVAAFGFGLLLPFILPESMLVSVREMIGALFDAMAAGEAVVWQSFGSVWGTFAIWLLVLWCCGWLPVGWPGVVPVILRAMLLGFSLMLLCNVDYGYGLLTGIALLLPGELVFMATMLLLFVPVRHLSVSLKKHEPCFSLRRYLALGVFCLLPAAFGSWLKASAGPWVLHIVLGWV